jgi:hypothetical protein
MSETGKGVERELEESGGGAAVRAASVGFTQPHLFRFNSSRESPRPGPARGGGRFGRVDHVDGRPVPRCLRRGPGRGEAGSKELTPGLRARS